MLLVLVPYLQEKILTDEVLKNFEMILRFLTTLYILTRTKSATKYIILWKVIIKSFKISNCFYLVIFHKKKSQGTKYGDQNVHFFDVTPYIIFTRPVFFIGIYDIHGIWAFQRYITLWVLSVHITSYALFNQNWCIFYNFGVWNTF